MYKLSPTFRKIKVIIKIHITSVKYSTYLAFLRHTKFEGTVGGRC